MGPQVLTAPQADHSQRDLKWKPPPEIIPKPGGSLPRGLGSCPGGSGCGLVVGCGGISEQPDPGVRLRCSLVLAQGLPEPKGHLAAKLGKQVKRKRRERRRGMGMPPVRSPRLAPIPMTHSPHWAPRARRQRWASAGRLWSQGTAGTGGTGSSVSWLRPLCCTKACHAFSTLSRPLSGHLKVHSQGHTHEFWRGQR